MDIILISLLVLLVGIASVILYLNLRSKPKDENENKEAEEIANLKTEIQSLKDTLNNTINTSLGSMSTSFNNLSTGVTKDMTEALTKVDEKVGNFNSQVELLNKSQESITKILAGVKKYGTLAEFSLDALIKDLLPATQFMTNVKMKEDTSENVEFAIKLQGDVLVPVDRLLNEVDIEPSEVLIVLFKVSFKLCISVFKLAISSASLFSYSSLGLDLKFKYRITEAIPTNKTNKEIKIISMILLFYFI